MRDDEEEGDGEEDGLRERLFRMHPGDGGIVDDGGGEAMSHAARAADAARTGMHPIADDGTAARAAARAAELRAHQAAVEEREGWAAAEIRAHEAAVEAREERAAAREAAAREEKAVAHVAAMRDEARMKERERGVRAHEQQLQAHQQSLHAQEQSLHVHEQQLHAQEKELEAQGQHLHAQGQQLEAKEQSLNAHEQQVRARARMAAGASSHQASHEAGASSRQAAREAAAAAAAAEAEAEAWQAEALAAGPRELPRAMAAEFAREAAAAREAFSRELAGTLNPPSQVGIHPPSQRHASRFQPAAATAGMAGMAVDAMAEAVADVGGTGEVAAAAESRALRAALEEQIMREAAQARAAATRLLAEDAVTDATAVELTSLYGGTDGRSGLVHGVVPMRAGAASAAGAAALGAAAASAAAASAIAAGADAVANAARMDASIESLPPLCVTASGHLCDEYSPSALAASAAAAAASAASAASAAAAGGTVWVASREVPLPSHPPYASMPWLREPSTSAPAPSTSAPSTSASTLREPPTHPDAVEADAPPPPRATARRPLSSTVHIHGADEAPYSVHSSDTEAFFTFGGSSHDDVLDAWPSTIAPPLHPLHPLHTLAPPTRNSPTATAIRPLAVPPPHTELSAWPDILGEDTSAISPYLPISPTSGARAVIEAALASEAAETRAVEAMEADDFEREVAEAAAAAAAEDAAMLSRDGGGRGGRGVYGARPETADSEWPNLVGGFQAGGGAIEGGGGGGGADDDASLSSIVMAMQYAGSASGQPPGHGIGGFGAPRRAGSGPSASADLGGSDSDVDGGLALYAAAAAPPTVAPACAPSLRPNLPAASSRYGGGSRSGGDGGGGSRSGGDGGGGSRSGGGGSRSSGDGGGGSRSGGGGSRSSGGGSRSGGGGGESPARSGPPPTRSSADAAFEYTTLASMDASASSMAAPPRRDTSAPPRRDTSARPRPDTSAPPRRERARDPPEPSPPAEADPAMMAAAVARAGTRAPRFDADELDLSAFDRYSLRDSRTGDLRESMLAGRFHARAAAGE